MDCIVLLLAAAVILAACWIKSSLHPAIAGAGAFLVLPVAGHMEDIELRVRGLAPACGRLRGASIILADLGADRETTEICRRLCREFPSVALIDGNRLSDVMHDSITNATIH